MTQITEEQKLAFAKDLEEIQKKHKIALFASLQLAPLKEEEPKKED